MEEFPFTVIAGKYEEEGERNYKYIEDFKTFEEAFKALLKVKGYPFARIEYEGKELRLV